MCFFFTWSICWFFPLFCCQSAPERFIYMLNSQKKYSGGGVPPDPPTRLKFRTTSPFWPLVSLQVWRSSVLQIVFLVTMVPAALRSLTGSSHVVLDWFLTVLMIIETPRGEILHGAPVRGRLTVILCFFHLRIITPTVVTFSPSCLAMVL